ncbi:NTP transferase domain-containing protein [Clostridium sp. AL.422]|uniref:NTP transferase domain-containing protein n=1 Tax=Clostridium TaxID=1485 RepID=UPI00293DF497|nr:MULTISPECIES: NTP transferase domain-containing protein [unclassified Clostridium]MDV4150398.1 NTP transferase domain-containing protein [Clostridium sp. AL.422]
MDNSNKNNVNNAIIMAAGLSSRFAPLSFEKPKGLLEVKGEILIERQIRQLQEAGIKDITIVVGYKKEMFYYLKDKFDVDIVVNNDYNIRNNNSTLYAVKERLKNTYICSSDNYFTKNVFESYVPYSYYSAVYENGPTDEYCITTNSDDIITDVTIGGSNSWVMLGHVYFSEEFSKKFVEILEREYNNPGVDQMLWEQIYINHLDELKMKIKRYESNEILEFDSLEDLRKFDESYITDSRSKIIKNICKILECDETAPCNFTQIKKGLTNVSLLFEVNNNKYIYRHPGDGTKDIINRESECYSQNIAKELGLDKTFIYMCPTDGWKISHYLDNSVDFDYNNKQLLKQAMSIVKKLHDSNIKSTWEVNLFTQSDTLLNLALRNLEIPSTYKIDNIRGKIEELYNYSECDGIEKRLCHIDCYDTNFLTDGKSMYLIDWEYSGNSDPACDIGTFICCSEYTTDEAMEVLRIYFGRELSPIEERHYVAYIAICSYYWFIWALYKKSIGDNLEYYLNLWYNYSITYSNIALNLYKNVK